MCYYNLIAQVVFCIFSCEHWIIFVSYFYIISVWKQSNWPCKEDYVKTPWCFYQRFSHLFFECRVGIEFETFWKIIFWRLFVCNVCCIVATSAPDFKHHYIFDTFYEIKKTFISERVPYFIQTFRFSSQTQWHKTKSVCVEFHWKQRLKIFVNCLKKVLI